MRHLIAILGFVACAGCLPFPEDSAGGPDATNSMDGDAATTDVGSNVQTGDAGLDAAGLDAGDASTDAGDAGAAEEWIQVAAGRDFACGLTNRGDVYCWGNRESGQFPGAPGLVDSPVRIDFGAGVEIVQISSYPGSNSVGGGTTCAVDALDDVWCWGQNSTGIVDSAMIPQPTPVAMGGTKMTAVEVGQNHACGIGTDTRVRCWGQNAIGQVGDTLDPVEPFFVPDPNTSGVTVLATGNRITYSLNGSSLRGWGNLEYHDTDMCNLGCNVTGDAGCSCPLAIPASNPTAIVPGPTSVCARLNGTLRCWGQNGRNQLGTSAAASFDYSSAPGLFDPNTEIGEFAVGLSFACAEANTFVRCWGDNSRGQLSTGVDDPFTDVPNLAQGLTNVDSMSAGAYFACAVSNGELLCWGDNRSRQLGRGPMATNNLYKRPEPVVTPW